MDADVRIHYDGRTTGFWRQAPLTDVMRERWNQQVFIGCFTPPHPVFIDLYAELVADLGQPRTWVQYRTVPGGGSDEVLKIWLEIRTYSSTMDEA